MKKKITSQYREFTVFGFQHNLIIGKTKKNEKAINIYAK